MALIARAEAPGDTEDMLDRYRPLVAYLVTEATFGAGVAVDGAALQRVGEKALVEALAALPPSAATDVTPIVRAPVRDAIRRAVTAAAAAASQSGEGGAALALEDADPGEVLAPAAEQFGGSWADALARALGTLPPAEADLLRAVYLDQLPAEEASRQLGIQPEEFRGRRSEALRRLGSAMGAMGTPGSTRPVSTPFARSNVWEI